MIDVKQQVNEVRRSVGDRTLEAGEGRVSTISQVYPTDITDLWEVVTDAERIGRWFLPVTGELKEGGHYQLEGNASGTITNCDKPNGYSATWEYGGGVSWISVRLTPEGDGTRFELEHAGQVPEEFWSQFGPGATGVGWDLGLYGLALLIDDPSAGPDKEKMATWHTTAEGQAFIRGSSDAWAAATVDYGTDPVEAKKQGDATYAFYTGT